MKKSIVIAALLFLGLSHGFTVERKPNFPNVGPFYHSVDHFSNEDASKEDYCQSLNGSCIKQENCTQCGCSKDDLFLSYKDGCKSFHKVKEAFNAKDNKCLYYEAATKETILLARWHMFLTCINLAQPVSFPPISFCYINNSYTVNIATGEIRSIKEELVIDKDLMCLTCKELWCNFEHLAGHFIYLDIKCNKQSDNKTVSSCFLFRFRGTAAGNFSLNATSTSVPFTTEILKTTKTATAIGTQRTTNTTTATSTETPKTARYASTKLKTDFTETVVTVEKETTSFVYGQSTKATQTAVSSTVLTGKIEKERKSSSKIIIIATVVSIVLVVVGVIVIFVIHRRRKQLCVSNQKNGPTQHNKQLAVENVYYKVTNNKNVVLARQNKDNSNPTYYDANLKDDHIYAKSSEYSSSSSPQVDHKPEYAYIASPFSQNGLNVLVANGKFFSRDSITPLTAADANEIALIADNATYGVGYTGGEEMYARNDVYGCY